MSLINVAFLLVISATLSLAQSPPETQHYAIDIAGIRVGTMSVMRQPQASNRILYTLISDVKIRLLVYTVTIFYKVVGQFDGQKLVLATVETHTNRGDYVSRTEWKGDHYDISANQYRYDHKAVERNPIDYTLSSLYFDEPIGRSRVFAEYFGDYFSISRTGTGTYRALLNDREDEYVYEKGRLVKVIKHNRIKNFVIRRLD